MKYFEWLETIEPPPYEENEGYKYLSDAFYAGQAEILEDLIREGFEDTVKKYKNKLKRRAEEALEELSNGLLEDS